MVSTTQDDVVTDVRRSRSGSNKRRLDALVGVRFENADKEALHEHARRLGFKNAQHLILTRLEDDLVAARELAS